jgi:hypothetical protein
LHSSFNFHKLRHHILFAEPEVYFIGVMSFLHMQLWSSSCASGGYLSRVGTVTKIPRPVKFPVIARLFTNYS